MGHKKSDSFSLDQLRDLEAKVESRQLGEAEWAFIRRLIQGYVVLFAAAEKGRLTIKRLRTLLFGRKSEKLKPSNQDPASTSINGIEGSSNAPPASSLQAADEVQSSDNPATEPDAEQKPEKQRPPGHGRIAADKYECSSTVSSHEKLKENEQIPAEC